MTTRPGYLIGQINPAKEADDTRPLFQGRIRRPDRDTDHVFAVWGHEGQHGDLIYSGYAMAFATPAEAIARGGELRHADGPAADIIAGQGHTLQPNQIALFINASTDESHPHRPAFTGHWQPGDGKPLPVSVWIHEDRLGRPMLIGQTWKAGTDLDPAAVEATPELLEELIAAAGMVARD
jgi:hypothetical protein